MLITHGNLVTMAEGNAIIPDGALLLRGQRIAALGPSAALEAAYPDEPRLDARGQWALPGMICAHTHFYGALARGISLPGPAPANLSQILEHLWWRLDKALQPEDIYESARVCLVDAIQHGTTTLIDHHASPHAIAGSLDVIAQAVQEAGVRACLCYEVSDRDGPDVAQAGLEENVRFIRRTRHRECSGDSRLTSAFGLHASFTLSDETLEQAVGLARALGVGFHIHLAEGEVDVQDALARGGTRTAERLARAGVLGPRTIAAHGVHLDAAEITLLHETGTYVVHNPRSNMNNGVGVAPVAQMLVAGVPVGLGNDGFSNNMFAEVATAYLLPRLAARDPRALSASQVMEMAFGHNGRLASTLFAQPLGRLAVGAGADVILVDYAPPTPVTAENWPWHVLFGLDGSQVTTTIVAGEVLMRDRVLTHLDTAEIAVRARERAAQLWRRLAGE